MNGERYVVDTPPGRYATVRRDWTAGDRLTVNLPMTLRTEELRGSPDRLAFLYGPVVLAGDLGPVERSESFPYAKDQWDNFEAPAAAVPELVGDPGSIVDTLRPVAGLALAFRAEGVLDDEPVTIELRPYAELPYRRYNVYWTVRAPQD